MTTTYLTTALPTDLANDFEKLAYYVNPRLYIHNKIVFEENYKLYIEVVIPEYKSQIESTIIPQVLDSLEKEDEKTEFISYINKVLLIFDILTYLSSKHNMDIRPFTIKWYSIHSSIQEVYDKQLFEPYLNNKS